VKPIRFRVVPNEDGMMLAQLVARRLPDVDADKSKALVRGGAVYMGHLRVRVPTVRVATGERITVYPQSLEVEEMDPSTLAIVHRDETFIVLDKPEGVPVAATRESARGTLAEALRRRLASEGIVRPYVGVVHRLDRGASGLVLFTVRSVANKSLHKQFAEHRIERTYRVLVDGDAPNEAVCEVPLMVLPGAEGMRAAKPGDMRAKPARTSFRKLASREGTSLLEATLDTGRTHQIRIHAAEIGHPIVGDRRYGRDGEGQRLHLHAWRLRFDHPLDGTRIELESTLPEWAKGSW
jgi:RluA family pseudouridine synthase